MVHNNGGVGIGYGTISPPDDGLIVDGRVGITHSNPSSALHVYNSDISLFKAENDLDVQFMIHNNGRVGLRYEDNPPKGNLHIVATDKPALFLEQNSIFSQGQIGWPDNEIFNLGTWNDITSTFTDVMEMRYTGEVAINKNGPWQSATFHVKQKNNQNGVIIENDGDADTWGFEIGSNDMFLEFNGSNVGYFDDATGGYTATSDRKLKKDIEYVEENVLERVSQLKPATYRLLHAEDDSQKTLGFIAQDVANPFPELVKSSENGNLALHYPDFGVLAIKAIQELSETVELQNELIDKLTQRIEALEKK